MIKIYSFASVLFLILVLIGCTVRFQAPKLEFVSLRHFQLRDTILFKDMQYYPHILGFTSDKQLEKDEYDYPNLLLYASAQNRGYNYHDVIQREDTGDEVFSAIYIKKVKKEKDKYYYDAVLSPTISKDDFRYVNDTVYCKIFYVRMFQSKPQTEEMKIPKDSLYILFDE